MFPSFPPPSHNCYRAWSSGSNLQITRMKETSSAIPRARYATEARAILPSYDGDTPALDPVKGVAPVKNSQPSLKYGFFNILFTQDCFFISAINRAHNDTSDKNETEDRLLVSSVATPGRVLLPISARDPRKLQHNLSVIEPSRRTPTFQSECCCVRVAS